jgi:hypothetical protein
MTQPSLYERLGGAFDIVLGAFAAHKSEVTAGYSAERTLELESVHS